MSSTVCTEALLKSVTTIGKARPWRLMAITTGGVFFAAACGLRSAANAFTYCSMIQMPSMSCRYTRSLEGWDGFCASADAHKVAARNVGTAHRVRIALKPGVIARSSGKNHSGLRNRRPAFPERGRLFERVRDLQHAKVVPIAADDLQADRQAGTAEAARYRYRRRAGNGNVIA